ncbi:hypothetical protein F4779DRAFT_591390 [Xylariaceae sp. FL0662B]|nr:hypothetical protein F4779DRAFT_591390 [Xylariaceae sp. FL0662B]
MLASYVLLTLESRLSRVYGDYAPTLRIRPRLNNCNQDPNRRAKKLYVRLHKEKLLKCNNQVSCKQVARHQNAAVAGSDL